jgi:hypothetical protein
MAIQQGRMPFPFGNDAYLGVVLVQVAVPGAVWFACWGRTRRWGQPDAI